MDPLSLTTSIITVISATNASAHSLLSYRRAPREVADLAEELTSLSLLLEQSKECIQQSGNCQPHVSAQGIFERIIDRAEKKDLAIRHLLASSLTDTTKARISWVRNRSRIKSIQDNLRVIRADLTLALGLLTR